MSIQSMNKIPDKVRCQENGVGRSSYGPKERPATIMARRNFYVDRSRGG